jgi:hypothetical protein
VGRDFDDGVFGDVLRDDRRKQEQAQRDAQRAGRAGGGAGKGPARREADPFDQLGGGGAPDPDVRPGKGAGRVPLG